MGKKSTGKTAYKDRQKGLTFSAKTPDFLLALKADNPQSSISDKTRHEYLEANEGNEDDDGAPQVEIGKGISEEEAKNFISRTDVNSDAGAKAEGASIAYDLPASAIGKSKTAVIGARSRVGKRAKLPTDPSMASLHPAQKRKQKNSALLSFDQDD